MVTDDDVECAQYYQRAAQDCRCCQVCAVQVCAGILQGGLCEDLCWCDDDDYDGMRDCGDDDQEPQP